MNKQTVLWAGYILGNAGLIMIYLLPQLVGEVTEQFGLNAQQSGLFASTDLAGSAIASISSFYWIRKANWKTMAYLALGIMIVGNTLSLFTDSFNLLLITRILTGLGQGIAIAITLVIVSDSRQTDRNFAIYLILTLLFGAGAVELLPAIFEPFSARPIYGMQIFLCVLTIPFVIKWLPVEGSFTTEDTTPKGLSFTTLVCLLGVLILYMGYGGLWALTELIGSEHGYTAEFIATALSVGLLAAIPALLIPILVGLRFGRTVPLIISCTGLILYSTILFYKDGGMSFLVAVVAGSFGVNLVIPYMTGIIAETDRTGKGVVMFMPMYAIGFALGPAVLSAIRTGDSYFSLSVAATLMFALVLVIYLRVLYKSNHG